MNGGRRGSVLLIAVGASAIIAALVVAQILRARQDDVEVRQVVRWTQNRAMLVAALQYIAETSRLGWDDPSTDRHEAAFGWRDIRDGRPGPRIADGTAATIAGRPVIGRDGGGGAFPAIDGDAARCPMAALRRPPWAVVPRLVPNPVAADPTRPWKELIGLANPSPMPRAATWQAFGDGDRRLRQPLAEGAWFRVRRSGVSTFIVTCGCGGSLGFADWREVRAAGATPVFGSAAAFAEIQADELRAWYEAEWSAAVGGNATLHAKPGAVSWELVDGACDPRDAAVLVDRQTIGSFAWIERLERPPPRW